MKKLLVLLILSSLGIWGQVITQIPAAAAGASPAGSPGACQLYATSSTFGGDATVCFDALTALSSPAPPVITHSGTAGAATWGYRSVARNQVGQTLPSTEGQTTTGNATLTGMNFNIVTTVAVTNSISCDVYRVTSPNGGGDTGWIGAVACGSALNDTGLTPSRFALVVPILSDITNSTIGQYIGGSLTVSKNVRFGASASIEEAGQFNVGVEPTTFSSSFFQQLGHANFNFSGTSTYSGVNMVYETSDSGGYALEVSSYTSGVGIPTAVSASAGNSGAATVSTANALAGYIQVISTGNLGNGYIFHAIDGAIFSSGALTNHAGFACDDLTIGTTLNACVYSGVNSGMGKWAFYGAGTAASQFGGTLQTAGYLSSDGSPGKTCSVVALGATITVKNGLITALTGC